MVLSVVRAMCREAVHSSTRPTSRKLMLDHVPSLTLLQLRARMRQVLPGHPQPTRQALCTANWDGLRLIV